MDNRHSEQIRQQEREEAYKESLADDMGQEFYLPIHHRVTENLNTENLEQASVNTQLSSSNIGFKLLQKMGWKGKGLGKEEQGIVEPIKPEGEGGKDAKLGIGKKEQYEFFTSEENIQRRKLDIELEETEELAKKREVVAEREQKIQSEVKEIRKVFLCELCNKQYKLAMEFEAHLSSYDHNHRKRFKEMKEMHAGSSRDDRQKREQLRQEKEMAKFAQKADAQRLQKQDESGASTEAVAVKAATSLVNPDQRKALKFGFGVKNSASKGLGNPAKKAKVVAKVSSIFGNDSDEES